MNTQDAQLTLALGEFYSAKTQKPEGETIEARFDSFHRLNPHVYRAIVALARKLKAQGQRKIGMKGLFEFLRWQTLLYTNGDPFRLNNDYTSRFARLVVEQEPDLAELFELRERRAA